MLNKTIKYTDYNGNEVSDVFYFNLTKAELMELEFETPGGMSKMIETIVAANDVKGLTDIVRKLILKSYGEKSTDGRFFMKNDSSGHPLSDTFVQSAAFSELFIELVSDADALTKFINSIIPRDLADQAAKEMEKRNVDKPMIEVVSKAD